MVDFNKLNALRFCKANEYIIHPTGSRYWNSINATKVPITKDTDYDFVAAFSLELAEKLRNNGFICSGHQPEQEERILAARKPIDWANPEITECETEENYLREGTVLVYYRGPVQVILKSNLEQYLKVQATIGVDFYVNYLWKKNNPNPDKIQDTLNFLYSLQY